jgi:ankyrin repeat protein
MRWTDAEGVVWSLHEACYAGRLDAVTALLDAGADPNGNAGDDDHWQWISAAGPHPRPLHCVAIAWEHKPEHAAIVKLLRAKGAVVEDTVLTDYWIETTLTDAAIAVGAALGEDERELRATQQEHGAVIDRYDPGKVLFVPDDDK